MNHKSEFNGDLQFGHDGENHLKELLESVEVKTDRQVAHTGNVVVEFEGFGGRPSGIATSNAKYWAFVFEQAPYNKKVVVIVETEYLRRHVQAWAINIKMGGDRNQSKMYVIPKERLLS